MSKIRVHHISDGDARYLVRGTTDLEVVRRLLEDDDYVRDEAPEDEDWEVELVVVRVGLFRVNPCGCGEHGWHLGFANKPGRGVFTGVYLDAHPVPVTFSVDEVLPDSA